MEAALEHYGRLPRRKERQNEPVLQVHDRGGIEHGIDHRQHLVVLEETEEQRVVLQHETEDTQLAGTIETSLSNLRDEEPLDTIHRLTNRVEK